MKNNKFCPILPGSMSLDPKVTILGFGSSNDYF